jgi:intein/homing endonuclease
MVMKHPIMGFEHLHRHSDFSLQDGFARVEEYAQEMPKVNQKYLCITDHGVMGAVPQQIANAEEHNLYPLFGCELYVNSMQPKSATREESKKFRADLDSEALKKKFEKSSHLLAIAYNDQGYHNLVRLTSWGWIHGFYKKPRVNHDALNQFKEGIIFTSTCANSEIANALFNEGEDAAWQMLDKYLAMFGENFYLELMMLDFELQKPYDRFLIKAHEKYGTPLILTQDCFVAGTLIQTDGGFKKIEDIVVGDMVLTHKGRYRKVEIVGSRALRNGESVFRVKTKMGTYAYEATGNHKAFTASNISGEWDFVWKPTDELTPSIDHLVIPKITEDKVFALESDDHIDLFDFIKQNEYQLGEKYDSSRKGNMGCRLQYNEESNEFWSYRGWDRKFKTVVPRFLKIDDDLLKIIGWYVAEGWSEKKSNQVGFALHAEERHVAEWIVSYFSKYGINSKIYPVSENGIAVRFSSVVFNRLFGQMCGFGANNKHLPYRDNKSWMRRWTKKQLGVILDCYWRGDGRHCREHFGYGFSSTSKILIHEVALLLMSCGVLAMPCVGNESKNHKEWKDSWYLSYSSGATFTEVAKYMLTGECSSAIHRDAIDYSDEYYLVPIKDIKEIYYDSPVYCFQVEEDHSLAAGFYGMSNCHYCKKEHSHNQHLQLLNQRGKTLADAYALKEEGVDVFELQDSNLWMKSEDELNEMWEAEYNDVIDYELYKQSKANTIKICEKAKGVQIDRELKLPKIPDADDKLWEAVVYGLKSRGCPQNQEYESRVKEEYELITSKGFSSYFLIQQMMTDTARKLGPEILGFGDGSECVGPGRGCCQNTFVPMRDASCKDISEIVTGDFVQTIDGSFREVKKCFKYPLNNENLLTIKCYYGDYKGFTLTKDHKVYVEKGLRPKGWDNWAESTKKARRAWESPQGNLRWIPAEEIEVGDWVFQPFPSLETKIANWDFDKFQMSLKNGSKLYTDGELAIHEFNGGGKFAGKQIRTMERYHQLNQQWAIVLGIFTGDGWLRAYSENCVDFCFGAEEVSAKKFVMDFFTGLGCDLTSEESVQGKAVDTVFVNNKYVHLLFRELFSGYDYRSTTKHVPQCILEAPTDIVEAYLHGYHLADGHEDEHKLKFSTSSKKLADQIRFLLARIGLPSSIGIDDRVDEREEFCNRNLSYSVLCPKDERICGSQFESQYGWRKTEDGFLLQVREISEISGQGFVYDIEVEGNHNYLTSSCLVHNSVCGSLIAYALRLHDVEPIIHDLKFSRFLSPARGGKQMRIRATIHPIGHEEISLKPEIESEVLEGKIDDIGGIF